VKTYTLGYATVTTLTRIRTANSIIRTAKTIIRTSNTSNCTANAKIRTANGRISRVFMTLAVRTIRVMVNFPVLCSVFSCYLGGFLTILEGDQMVVGEFAEIIGG
jgi:hypothetical protein